MNIQDWTILRDLSVLVPSGLELDHLTIYPPNRWKDRTLASLIKEIVQYYPTWSDTKFVLIGGSHFGDEVLVTQGDPISSSGAIYISGSGAGGRQSIKEWPESMLRLSINAKDWIDRLKKYGDEFAVALGSLDDALGDKAAEYRSLILQLNPGLSSAS